MTLLTEDQYRAITVRVSGYPDRTAVAPAYPAPRRRKPLREGETLSPAEAQLPPPPQLGAQRRIRLVDFLLLDTINSGTDVIAASHRILGPALIDWIYWMQDASNNQQTKLSIFICDDGNLVQGAQTSPFNVAGTPIFEWNNHDNIGVTFTVPNSIGTFHRNTSTADSQIIPIKYPVTKSEFFIKVRFSCTGTINSTPSTHVLMRLVEGYDPLTIP